MYYCLLLSLFVVTCAQSFAGTYRVFFRDKGGMPFIKGSVLYKRTESLFTKRALERRARVITNEDSIITLRDAPVFQDYIDAIVNPNPKVKLLLKVRWQNYIVIECDSAESVQIAKKPFVRLVAATSSIPIVLSSQTSTQTESFSFTTTNTNCGGFRYGPSFKQNALMNAHELHAMGITGQNVLIGILDNGFRWKYHTSLKHVNVADEYDFVFNDTNTENDTLDIPSQDGHGSPVFGVIAGLQQDSLIGVAPYSSFLLAKTEDMRSERRIEEDYYAAGIEWMESLGADISTSSLGYYGYDATESPYSYDAMDGKTTISAVACNYATKMGMVCISAAGNSGGIEKTIVTPADGDSVLAVGAFANDTTLRPAGFTSKGPTATGRMKPDIAALGVGTVSYILTSVDNIGRGFTGTSFATPLIAGATALLKSAYPELTTHKLRRLLQNYASHATNPNNAIGFGMPNLLASCLAYGILCSPPIWYPGKNAQQISYRIKSDEPLSSAILYYRRKGASEWESTSLQKSANDFYVARLSQTLLGTSGTIEYYIEYNTERKRGRMPSGNADFSTSEIGQSTIPCGIPIDDIPTSVEVSEELSQQSAHVLQLDNGVHIWSDTQSYQAQLFSIAGTMIATMSSTDGHVYFTQNLPTGTYYCVIHHAGGSQTLRFVVIK